MVSVSLVFCIKTSPIFSVSYLRVITSWWTWAGWRWCSYSPWRPASQSGCWWWRVSCLLEDTRDAPAASFSHMEGTPAARHLGAGLCALRGDNRLWKFVSGYSYRVLTLNWGFTFNFNVYYTATTKRIYWKITSNSVNSNYLMNLKMKSFFKKLVNFQWGSRECWLWGLCWYELWWSDSRMQPVQCLGR